MKNFLCVLIVFALSLQKSYSQKTATTFPYTVGDPHLVFDFDNCFYFSKNKEILAVKFIRNHAIIQKFSTDKPSLITAKKYDGVFPSNFKIENILELGDKYYFFYSSRDNKEDKMQLFSIDIDFEKGEFNGQPKLLLNVDGKVSGVKKSYGFFNLGTSIEDNFKFIQSSDKKQLLITYRKIPEIKNDKNSFDKIGLNLYGNNLNVIFQKEIIMPYSERRMDNLDYQIDNIGNMYMLVKVFHDESNKDKISKDNLEPNYHIELFTIKSGGDKIETTKFKIENKFINKLKLYYTRKGYLVCGGFYSNGKDLKRAKLLAQTTSNNEDCDGIIVFKINSAGVIYDTYSHEIPLEVINAYEVPKTKEKNKLKEIKEDNAKMKYLEFRDIDVLDDESIVVIGEQNYNVTSGGGMNTMASNVFGNILICKIDSKGDSSWMHKIPKIQGGNIELGNMSYRYFSNLENLYLVFLDNAKNLNLPIDKEPFGFTRDLTGVKISKKDGVLSREFILNTGEINNFSLYKFSMNRFLQISDDSFIFEAYKKDKEDIMIKVHLN